MFMRNLLIVNALVARKSIETKREQTSIGTLQHIFYVARVCHELSTNSTRKYSTVATLYVVIHISFQP